MSKDVMAETYLRHYRMEHPKSPKLSKRAREKFKADFERLSQERGPILTDHDARDLLNTLSPDLEQIQQLLIFEEGWVCRFQGCKYAWSPDAAQHTLTKHLHNAHNGKHSGLAGTMRRGTVQRLGRDRRRYYFTVNTLLNDTDPGSDWRQWRQKLHADPHIQQKMFPASAIDPDERAATDNFHLKTRWVHHAQEYSVPQTLSLITPPRVRDPLHKLIEISRRWIHLSRQTMENIDPIYLRQLNHWKRFTKEFTTVGAGSEVLYAGRIRKLVLFLIRVSRRSPNIASGPVMTGTWDTVKDLNDTIPSIDTPENNDIVDAMVPVEENFGDDEDDASDEEEDDDFADIRDHDPESGQDDDDEESSDTSSCPETADDAKPQYPVFLTLRQSTAALQLFDALEQDLPDSDLDTRFQACLLAAFTDIDSTQGNRFHTPMEAFLFALNLRRDGSVNGAVLVTPSLSAVQYGILVCILKDALSCSAGIESGLKSLHRWFDPSQISAFATVRYYQGVGWSTVKNLIGVARVLFFKRGEPDFMFDNIKCSTITWINFVHHLWRKAEEILRVELLMDLTDEQLDLGRLRTGLKDHAQELADGYGFAPRDTGTLEHIMKVLFSHRPFLAKFFRCGEFCADALWSFCGSANTFKQYLLMMIHLTGAPKRLTELLLHKLYNTFGRPRNVRLMLERFFLIGDYSKTTANTGADKLTIHLLPPALELLFIRLCLVVLPLERYFLFHLEAPVQKNAHSYLFSSLGQRWDPKKTRSLIPTLTKSFFGKAFNVSQVRHIVRAIIVHYDLDVSHQPSRGVILARQQGNSRELGGRLYANPQNLPNTVTSARVMEVSEFSDVFHAFMGLASPDGPTTVTAESLRKFAARYDPEAKFDALTTQVDRVMVETRDLNRLLHERCGVLEDKISALTTQVHALFSTTSQVHTLPVAAPGSQQHKFDSSISPQSHHPSGLPAQRSINQATAAGITHMQVQEAISSNPPRPTTPPAGQGQASLKRSFEMSPSKPSGRDTLDTIVTAGVELRSHGTVQGQPLEAFTKRQRSDNMPEVRRGDEISLLICPECKQSISPSQNGMYGHFTSAGHNRFAPVKLPKASEPSAYLYRRMGDGRYVCHCKKEFATDADVNQHIADFLETCTERSSEHYLGLFMEEPEWAMMTKNAPDRSKIEDRRDGEPR
ncbi:hypothetical protein K438DRAFT_1780138 [Mycena galopus ATCC 62051]|nr:hypothetical protein K438DRAFT_1780138 [Mycena galopus ATCC 62051]